jgi:hypothetical protein
VSTLSDYIGDQRKMNEDGEHDVELVEPGEDSTESFEPTEQPLDFVTPFVHRLAVVLSGDLVEL